MRTPLSPSPRLRHPSPAGAGEGPGTRATVRSHSRCRPTEAWGSALNANRRGTFLELWVEALKRSGRGRLAATGTCMLPTLRPGQEVGMEPCRGLDCKLGEVVVYRGAESLVAHRVVGAFGRGDERMLVHKGDNSRVWSIASRSAVVGRVVGSDRQGGRLHERILGHYYSLVGWTWYRLGRLAEGWGLAHGDRTTAHSHAPDGEPAEQIAVACPHPALSQRERGSAAAPAEGERVGVGASQETPTPWIATGKPHMACEGIRPRLLACLAEGLYAVTLLPPCLLPPWGGPVAPPDQEADS